MSLLVPALMAGVAAERGRRRTMEDAHVVCNDLWALVWEDGIPKEDRPHCALYGIYDGHGGPKAAAFAAEKLHCFLAHRLNQLSSAELQDFGRVVECVRAAYAEMEEKWMALAEAQDLEDGTTAVTAMVLGDRLFVANLGDSRLIVGGQAGAVRFRTLDHKPDATPEKVRIEAAGGFVREVQGVAKLNGAITVARAIGTYELKSVGGASCTGPALSPEPEITVYQLTTDDCFMLLACDGLWDVLDNGRAAQLVWGWLTEGMALDRAATRLVTAALCEPSQNDNVTAVVVSLQRELSVSLGATASPDMHCTPDFHVKPGCQHHSPSSADRPLSTSPSPRGSDSEGDESLLNRQLHFD